MSSNAMLEINDLVVSVEDNRILNGLNLKINKGEIHAIMGPNGSGKSTLSNVIAGKPGYVVENGEIIAPIENMRFDDTIYNVFGSELESVTDTTQLIPDIGTYDGRNFGGTYSPGILLKSFDLTL